MQLATERENYRFQDPNRFKWRAFQYNGCSPALLTPLKSVVRVIPSITMVIAQLMMHIHTVATEEKEAVTRIFH